MEQYNLWGLAVGALTFLTIGLFHPLVIKAEYYFGVRSWWAFLALGVAACAWSLAASGYVSIIAGVVAFSSFWSILEVFEQRKRVQKGWFPRNPKRK